MVERYAPGGGGRPEPLPGLAQALSAKFLYSGELQPGRFTAPSAAFLPFVQVGCRTLSWERNSVWEAAKLFRCRDATLYRALNQPYAGRSDRSCFVRLLHHVAAPCRTVPHFAARWVMAASGEEGVVRVTASLSRTQEAALKELAAKHKVSVAWMVRHAVDQLVEQGGEAQLSFKSMRN